MSYDWSTATFSERDERFRAWSLGKYGYDPADPEAAFPDIADFPELDGGPNPSARLVHVYQADQAKRVLDGALPGYAWEDGKTNFRPPCECPCPGHQCAGRIYVGEVTGTATWRYDYEYWQWSVPSQAWVNSSSGSDGPTTGSLDAEPSEAVRFHYDGWNDDTEVWERELAGCWPRITVFGTNSVSLFVGVGSAYLYTGAGQVVEGSVLPLTQARAYTVTGSDSGTETWWEIAIQNLGWVRTDTPRTDISRTYREVTLTWSGSFSVRYAVHQEFL
jgi:hypothetical protein